MSDEYNEDSDLVKDLRKQLDAAKDENKSLRKENEGLQVFKTKVTVDDVIAEKGLNPKIKALIPKDTEDVSAWLEEFGDLFGGATTSTDEAGDDAGASEEVDALDGQSDAEGSGAEDSGLLAQLEATASMEELRALVEANKK